MEEIEFWELEFSKDEYNDILKFITNLRETGTSWEILKDIELLKKIRPNIREKEEEYWDKLLDFVKHIEEGTIPFDVGTELTTGEKNLLTIPNSPRSAWQILKKKLYAKNIYTIEELAGMERQTIKIINNLSLSTGEDSKKGMIMGYVQSGKTTSIEALITMAADCGWNMFIILSGTLENLRQQNLLRLENDIKYGSNGNIHWMFSPNIGKDNLYESINNGQRVVTVCLKNSKRLKDLKDWIFDSSAQNLANARVILIDDEADQASINTKDISDEERSRINKLIVDLVNQKNDKKLEAMNYVGYTATPYANFLNEGSPESLYPKDFIYTLPKSTQYVGPQEIFGNIESDDEDIVEGLNIKRIISSKYDYNDYEKEYEIDNDLEEIRNIEKGESNFIPNSLIDALCWFICTVAVFRYKKVVKPVSMLIHTNRKIDSHMNMSNAIKRWLLGTSKEDLLEKCEKIYNEETKKLTVEDVRKVLKKYRKEIEDYPQFDVLRPYIFEIISKEPSYMKLDEKKNIVYSKGIHTVIDNCSINGQISGDEYARLAYPTKESNVDFATAFIVIGGDTLARGLTIEGLTTSYFCRSGNQMDTLMQMGRWFGYRIGYELLPRIWMDQKTLQNFNDLTQIEVALREDLKKYEKDRILPSQYGPIIKTSWNTKLKITSKNKMHSATAQDMNYMGAKSQTTIFERNDKMNSENIDLTEEFLDSIDGWKKCEDSANVYVKNIEFEKIKEYLLKYQVSKRDRFFSNMKSFCEWVDKTEEEYVKKWNIIVAGIKENDETDDWEVNGNKMYKVSRTIRKTKNMSDKYFNIGALRSTKDILSDIEYDERKDKRLDSEKEIIAYREAIKEPQLIIYRIDKNSKYTGKNKNKINLESNTDLIGLYLFLPGKPLKDFVQSVTVQLSFDDIMNDEESDD